MENFDVRRTLLFASLDSAAEEIGKSLRNNREFENDDERMDIDFVDTIECNNSRLGGIRGRRSIFRRPNAPINSCLRSRRLSDYQRNSHKWKKYTLADADDSDLANRVGALLFLSTYGKGATEQVEKEAEAPSEIKFKKKNKCELALECTTDNPDAQLDNPQLKGSKLVMPEYTIGKKRVTKKTNEDKKSASNKVRAAGKLTLSHLQNEDEDDDDDE